MISALCFLAASATVAVSAAPEDRADLEERVFREAVASAAPSIVRIETFGGQERVGRVLVSRGPTTGVVVDEAGYIVSSSFNFVQQPASILVTLPSGKRVPARIVSRDTSRMLVLIKVDTTETLTAAGAVPIDEIVVGQWSIAVGRTFDPATPNVSVGIVSATNRIWGKAIQTDAKISPSNYGGPLVDIRGRTLGILVPLSPDSSDALAGTEWYDSGIGFAIPLADVQARLEQFKQGDLAAGLLGITLKGSGPNVMPAEVAACQIKSPAHEAGIRAGDIVVACEGVPIERSGQLRHVLGRLYAGDRVQLVALRGEERVEADAELVAKLTPYETPFLGILPVRGGGEDPSPAIRYVFPGSGAAEAGLQAGDRIVQLNEAAVAGVEELRMSVANLSVGDRVKLQVQRENAVGESETRRFDLALTSLPTNVPTGVPPDAESATAEQPQGEDVEIVIPEEANACFAYVPPLRDPAGPYGLLLHIATPGDEPREELLEKWREFCAERQTILVVPRPRDPRRWTAPEVEFVRKTIDHVKDNYDIDPQRVAVLGHRSAGTMAYFVAFRLRDDVRGVVVVNAAVRMLRAPGTDPVKRLAFYVVSPRESDLSERIQNDVEQLREQKHNLLLRTVDGDAAELDAGERANILRWLDTLDRI